MTDGHRDNSVGERKLIWDEENRLLAVDDNGFVSNYWYDADGERTVKTSGESDQVFVNGVFSGGSTNTAKFSLYVSPYLVANQGGRYTKHIYAGSQRIVSKVGDFASYGSDPRRIEYAGANTDGLSVDYKSKYAAQQQVIKDNYKFFDVPYNGTDNDNYADGEGFCCNDGSMEAAVAQARKAQTRAVSRSFKDPDNYENLQFFYHPDHLGSSSFITNLDGEVVQHIEYVPFGEVFIEERNNVWNTPYLFNAKEFDEETGMYYYGARYYGPRLSLWISTDPQSLQYLFSSTYCYSMNNPIKYVDPDGEAVKPAGNSELQMIRNTLPVNARKYVQIGQDGWINSELLNSYTGDDLNTNNLKELVNSSMSVDVRLDDKFTYASEKGTLGEGPLSHFNWDPEFDSPDDIDSTGSTISCLSTGENGNLGKTLFPDRDGLQNSPNESIIIIVHKALSSEGAAEIYSHEANGHALLYIRNGGDHKGASHQITGTTDYNTTLVNMIVSSKQETVKNMKAND